MAMTLKDSAAGCSRARQRRRNEWAAGSHGPGVEGAAAARALVPSLARRAGREGDWQGEAELRGGPAPWAPGRGGFRSRPPSPAAAAAAPLRL